MRASLLLAILVALAACGREASPLPAARRPVTSVVPGHVSVGEGTVNLPKQVGDWVRPDASSRITADTIFDYMDGAGEMYLAYRFDHLDVFEYKAEDGRLGTILVELYSMKASDDAFGLLSNDWGGEAVPFDPGPGQDWVRAAPPHRALYGAGLLRMWKRCLYARILASSETEDSRAAVLTLGKAIISGGSGSEGASDPPPGFLRSFDAATGRLDPKRPVRPERTCLFRSYLVLNSAYFLASQDILGLGPDVVAATTEYAPAAAGERPVRVVVVGYPSAERARAGLKLFGQNYLADAFRGKPVARTGSVRVEHGWVAWTLWDASGTLPGVTLVFDAPDRSVARRFADSVIPVGAPSK